MTKPKGIEDTILQRLGLQNDNLHADFPAVKTLRNKVSSMKSKLKKDGVMTTSTHIVTPKNSNRLNASPGAVVAEDEIDDTPPTRAN